MIAAGLVAPGSEARVILYTVLGAAYSAITYSAYRVPVLASIPVALLALNMVRTPDVPTILAGLERERVEDLRRAAERERARIARELQAGAARTVMDAAPDLAREALLRAPLPRRQGP
ncbi:hypothetical protein [Streptomyces beijiangensis]|uniref:hypothetical protein n=1 Tax=Streptomyces beijiangensis TaxID=163361 RepID=UPI0031DD0304